jgi:hypothetical protein
MKIISRFFILGGIVLYISYWTSISVGNGIVWMIIGVLLTLVNFYLQKKKGVSIKKELYIVIFIFLGLNLLSYIFFTPIIRGETYGICGIVECFDMEEKITIKDWVLNKLQNIN